jgi:hypothetical protein
MKTKICKGCGKEKDINEFRTQLHKATGVVYRCHFCRDCANK